MPGREHSEKACFADDVSLKISNGEPESVFPSVIDEDICSLFFLIGRLSEAALEHDFGLIEPMGEELGVLRPLLTQYDLCAFDLH